MDFLKCRLCNIKELPKYKKDRTDNTLYIYKGEPKIWRNGRLRSENHKDKIKQQNKKYREKNKDKIIQYHKEYGEKHKDKIKQQKKQRYQENKDKIRQKTRDYCKKNKVSVRINAWLQSGFKHTDEEFKEIFKRREESTKCELCNTKYKNNSDKHTDHHHSSGSFRNICCNKCNNNRRPIDRKMDKVLLELHRYFLIN